MNLIVLAMLLGAALFVLFGLVDQRACNGHCAGCVDSCERQQGKAEHPIG